MTMGGGHGLLVYVIMALIMPEDGAAKARVLDDEEIVIKGA